jgi:hypothetical protein
MSKRESKTRWFLVPKGTIGDFFTQLEETELDYELSEVEDDMLKVEVTYEDAQRDDVMSLIEILDEFSNEEEETEEEES